MLPIAFDSLSSDRSAVKRLADTFKKPLVIAAILGFLLTLGGSKMPTQLASTFDLLGKGAGGVAIFAAGIVLGTRHLSFDKTILTTVMMKNIVFPLVVLLIMMAAGVSHDLIRLVVIAWPSQPQQCHRLWPSNSTLTKKSWPQPSSGALLVH